MFSFMTRNSSFSKDNDKNSEKPNNSSHSEGSLFGGMSVNDANKFELADASETTPSAFSFMSSSSHENNADTSGFQFIADNVEDIEKTHSSFSFMLNNGLYDANDNTPDLVNTNIGLDQCLTKEANIPVLEVFHGKSSLLLSSSSSSSSGKAVKKKKRASRVGFAREDDLEDAINDGLNSNVDNGRSVSSLAMIIEDDNLNNDETVSQSGAPLHSSHLNVEDIAPSDDGMSAFDFLSVTSAASDDIVPISFMSTDSSSNIVSSNSKVQEFPNVDSQSYLSQGFVGITSAKSQLDDIETETQSTVEILPVSNTTDLSESAESLTPRTASVAKLTLLSDLVDQLTKLQNTSISERKQIRSDIDFAVQTSVELRARLGGLELEQNRLAQEEDFERAEAMNDVINQARVEIDVNIDHIKMLKVSAVNLSNSFQLSRQSLLDRIASEQSELDSVKVALENELSVSSLSGAENRSCVDELEESRLRAEQERISLEKSHFEREEEALSNELQVTEEAIRTQSGDFQTSREAVELNLLSVQSEIKRLEQQLLVKRQEERSLLLDLTQVETKIGEVRKKYERQLQRIHDRSQALASTKFECLSEERALTIEHEIYLAKIRQVVETRAALTRWTSAVGRNLDALLTFIDGIKHNDELLASQQRSLLSLVSSISSCDSTDVDRNGLQDSLDQCYISLLGAQKVLEGLESQMTALTTESHSISEQIPKLEVEKKTHATSKRFKEAAAVAKDIKDFLLRRDVIDQEVGSVGAAMDEQALVVSSCRNSYNAAVEELKEAHRQQDIARFDTLLTVARLLRGNKSSIGNIDFSGEDLEPFRNLNEAMERLLDDELFAVLFEAEIIKGEHTLPNSLEELEDEISEHKDSSFAENIFVDEQSMEPCDQNESELLNGDVVDTQTGALTPEDKNLVGVDIAVNVSDVETECASVLQAQKVRDRLEQLRVELAAAEEDEDYEQAAELFEEINDEEKYFQELLDHLKMLPDELPIADSVLLSDNV